MQWSWQRWHFVATRIGFVNGIGHSPTSEYPEKTVEGTFRHHRCLQHIARSTPPPTRCPPCRSFAPCSQLPPLCMGWISQQLVHHVEGMAGRHLQWQGTIDLKTANANGTYFSAVAEHPSKHLLKHVVAIFPPEEAHQEFCLQNGLPMA